MTSSEEITALLKHKGIGPEGSKSLTSEQLDRLTPLLNDESISLTTRATLLTAMIMLEPTQPEEDWIMSHQPFDEFLPKGLTQLFTHDLSDLSALNLEIIQHEDLSPESAYLGAKLLLDPSIQNAEKAVFLEGQRLKRETFEENLGFFKAFNDTAQSVEIDKPDVILFGDSFDGCQRINPYTIFSCAVLSSLDVHSYMTGVETVAPKNGITAHQILQSANLNIPKSLKEGKNELITRGWTYIDQSVFFPELSALLQLRADMVKRPFLATFEKMLAPLKAKRTHLVTAYTHKAYRSQVVELNDALEHIESMINLKGMEATSRPHLGRESDFVKLSQNLVEDGSFTPEIINDINSKETPSVSQAIALGEAALIGTQNFAYSAILNQCILVLTEMLDWKREDSIDKVRNALDSGAALAKWK
jgi:anthranilate phosphoribosyltransferase